MLIKASGNTASKAIAPQTLTSLDLNRKEFKLALFPLRLFSVVLLVKLLTACSSQSPKDELAKELQSVKSWTATAHMVGDAWRRGDVPTPYVKETLEKTQEELKNETDTLSKLSIEPSQRATVLEQLKRFEDTVGQMSKVVEQKNPQAMTQQIQQLSIQQQRLDKLAKTVGR